MRRALIITLALSACGIEVQVGLSGSPPPYIVPATGAGGGGGGGGRVSMPCTSPPILAWEVTAPPAPPLPGSCFLPGSDAGAVLPELHFVVFAVNPTRPTFELVPVERTPTLGIVGLDAQSLGDAQLVKIPQAIAGQGNAFTWFDTLTVREQFDGPGRKRVVGGGITIDRLDTPFSGGTLNLASLWVCEPSADGGCLAPLTDQVSCTLTRTLTAHRVPMEADWYPPRPVDVDAGLVNLWLVSLDVSALSDEDVSCASSTPSLVQTSSDGVRSLQFWQTTNENIYLPEQEFGLRGAPPITIGPVLTQSTFSVSSTTEQTAGAIETRSSSVGLQVATSNAWNECATVGPEGSARDTLSVSSAWSCTGANCPLVTSSNHESCAAALRFEALFIQ